MFMSAMVRIFSFGENGMFQSTRLRLVDWNTPFSPHENILTIALINIHYLYNIVIKSTKTTHKNRTPKHLACFQFSVSTTKCGKRCMELQLRELRNLKHLHDIRD